MSPTFSKGGGASSKVVIGGIRKRTQLAVDSDQWVITFFRAFKDYVLSNVDLDIYEVVFSFPTANDLGKWLPLDKTLIHFEMDDSTNPTFGFGDNVISVDQDSPTSGSITEHEALEHRVNWDIGIWASERSGGVTARLMAFQVVNDLFAGALAYQTLRDATGIEIKNFVGGTFIKEDIDGIDIFRVGNMILETRVYSRRTRVPVPYISIQDQDPALLTQDNVVITG